MKRPAGVGALFANKAKSGFLSLTGSRYDSMQTRMEKKKLPPLPFTKEEFRAHILAALGGHDDGARTKSFSILEMVSQMLRMF